MKEPLKALWSKLSHWDFSASQTTVLSTSKDLLDAASLFSSLLSPLSRPGCYLCQAAGHRGPHVRMAAAWSRLHPVCESLTLSRQMQAEGCSEVQFFANGTAVLILHNSECSGVPVCLFVSLSYLLREKLQLLGRKCKYSFSPSHETRFHNSGLSHGSELSSTAVGSVSSSVQHLSRADDQA